MTDLSLRQYFTSLDESKRSSAPNINQIRAPKQTPTQRGSPSKGTPSKLDLESGQ